MICPNCKTENMPASPQCVHCGFSLRSGAGYVPELPPLPPLPEDVAAPAPVDPLPTPTNYPAPPQMPSMPPGYSEQTQAPYPGAYPVPYVPAPSILDTMIPMRNPKALTGYYLAVFSFIPLLGLLLGIAAFVLGIQGLKEVNRNPAIKGKAHAWVAILVGGFFGFGYLILVAWGVIAVILASAHSAS
jgi:hypothetical protein